MFECKHSRKGVFTHPVSSRVFHGAYVGLVNQCKLFENAPQCGNGMWQFTLKNEELKSTLTEMEVHFDLTKQTQFKDKLEL